MSTYSTKRMPAPIVYRTRLGGLERLHEGKVRDIYAVDAGTLLIVTTDRLSAFDVVLPDPIPDKGCVLNSISNFWFAKTQHLTQAFAPRLHLRCQAHAGSVGSNPKTR